MTADGYHEAGETLSGLAVPTVAVQEGGYHLPTVGALVVARRLLGRRRSGLW